MKKNYFFIILLFLTSLYTFGQPCPVATATPTTETICSGGNSNIVLTSNETGTIFTWTVVQTDVSGASDGSSDTIVQTLTATSTTPGTAVYTITPTANGCDGAIITITVTVQSSVTSGTIGTAQTICNGSTPATLTSTTAGTGSGTISYEWQTNASGSYVDIGTATSATYSPPSLTATTSYQRRTVSTLNGVPCYSAYTTPITITVQSSVTAGAIGTAQTICNGATPATLTSTAGTGSGTISYEWQTNASGSYVTIGGATADTYSPPSLTATTSYQRRTVSTLNGVPCYSAYTTPITITVQSSVTSGTIGTAQTICNGSTPATLTSTTAGTGSGTISYEWQTNASGSYVDIGTATSATYSLPSLTATTSYQRRTVSTLNGVPCYSAYTTPITITVQSTVTAGAIGTAQTICNGATPATLTSTAGTGSGTISYEWQTNASGSYVTIGGATADTYSPPSFTATTSYQRRTVSTLNGVPCYSAYTTPITITVQSSVTSGTIGTAQTICNGSTPATLTSTTAGTGSGTISYEWQTNASGSYVDIGTATSATYSPPSLTATTSYQRRTVSTLNGVPCYSAYTTPITITVQSAVTSGTIGTAQTICNGVTPAAFTSTAGTGSGTISYEWQTNASGSYVTIGGATADIYSPPSLTATTSYQRRTVSTQNGVPCYSAYTTPITITVQSTVTAGAIGTAQTICNGATPATLTSTAGTGSGTISYEWQTNASGSYVDIGTATSATYSPPSLTATTSYQRRTVSTLNGVPCYSAYTTPITITVQSAVTSGTIGTAQTICNGATPATLTSTAGTGSGTISYEWQTNASGSYVTIGGATADTYSTPSLTATTSYQRRTVSTQNGVPCYSAYTTPITITVQSAVTSGTIGTAQTICNGVTPAAFTSTAGTGSGTISYEWQTNASGSYVTIGGAIANTYSPPSLTATTSYQRRTVSILNSVPCYSAYTTPITITVQSTVTAGVIGTAQTICNGATPAALTSTTAGTGSGTISYQWQTNASGSYVDIGTATSATYSPPSLTATTSYQRRTVSTLNGVPCYSAYTTAITITVQSTVTAGAIGTAQTICNGATPATLTSTTAGTGSGTISYQWQTNASGSYVTIGGATADTYSPPSLTATTSYQRRTVSTLNSVPCYSAYTTPITITVQSAVTSGAIGTAQTICNGATPAALTSTTAGTGSGTISYQWQTNASGSYVDIGTATSATYSPPSLTATTSYQRRTVSTQNGVPCYSAYTTAITITVQSTVTAGAIGTAQTICNGATPATLTSTTAGTGSGTISYQWQTNASGSYVTIGGATADTYSPPSLTATTSYQRRTVSILNSVPCYSAYTTPITITVQSAVTSGAIGTAQTICNGATPAALTSTTAGTGSGTISYQWQTNASGSYVDIGTATSATYSPGPLTATTSYQRRTVSTQDGVPCYSAYTTPITITVQSTVTAGVIGTAQTICTGATPAALTSTTAGTGSGTISYQWQTNASGSYVTIGGATSATYSPPSLTATTSYQRRTVSTQNGLPCYSAYTTPITIIVNPTAQVNQPTSQVVCNGSPTTTVNFGTTNSGGTTTYSWANNTTSIGLAASGMGNIASFTAINTGSTPVTATIIVTPTFNNGSVNCTGPTKTFTITVNPKPIVTLTNVTAQCSTTLTAPTATDNCGVTVTGTTGDPLIYNTQGTYVVTWSFAFGTVITSTQNIIIDDTIAPVPNTANLPDVNKAGCELTTLPAPTATDTCKGTITGTTTTPFPITTEGTTVVTWTYNDGNGNTTTQTQNVILTAPSISGGSLSGYISDLVPTPAATDNIAITSCPNDSNPITINLSGETGTIVRWEKFEAGGTTWSAIANTADTHTYNTIFNFSNTKSTLFRALIQVGNCTQYSNMVNVHAIPPDVPPILDQNLFNICLGAPVTLIARSGYTSTVNVGNGGDFNTGQFPAKWDPTQWKIDGEVAGTAWTAAANNTKVNNWTGTNDAKNVGTSYIIKYDNGATGKKFGMAHGNYNSAAYISKYGVGPTTLETPIFSLEGLAEASICFDQAYNLHAGDYAKLELSLDGGTTYDIPLQELIGTNPPLTWDWQNHSPSTASYYMFANDNSCFDLYEYIKEIPAGGLTNLRVKWTFFGTTDESVWAIDNITIPVKPYSDELEWTDGIGEPGEYIIKGKLEVAYTFIPSAPGVHQYGATSLINGCRAYDPAGTAIATVKVNYAYAGEAVGYTNAECGERTVNLNAYDNTKTADQNNDDGAYPTLVRNDFSDDPGTGATGKWTVFNTTNTCGTYSFSNDVSPTSSFSGDAGIYTLRWTLVGTGCFSDVQVTLTSCDVIDFDGVDDYVAFKNNYGLGSAFSIEVWVKPDPQPVNPLSTIQTILSKRNANSLVDGYDLRLVGSTLTFNWNNGSKITSPFPLTTSRWYHVAVTYSGGIYILYIDGIEVIRSAGSAPTINSFECIAGAMDQTGNPPNKPVNHFSGWMDELRIWDVGLSPDHVRQMMNQQIINNGAAVRGEIIPIDINGPDANKDGTDDQPLNWANLKGYYRMNLIDCGYLKPFGGKGVDGKLRNITSSQEETAPLPYVSIRDGNWTDRGTGTTPWKYSDSVWDYPNSIGYNGTLIDWNIVQTAHNISSGNKDITVLGLISTAGRLTVADPTPTIPIEKNDGQGVWITHYLKLNGTIDLVGESQLVQKRYGTYNPTDQLFMTTQFSESIFDATSLGYIERDQQGKQNSFNYNYWSSPVSTIQGLINNTPHTVSGILRDGTNSAVPKTITFGDGAYFADGSLSSPINISNRWIWSYNSPTLDSNTDWDDYFQWNYIANAGLLKTGEGFTMKGTGGTAAIDALQNHVFIGKPNSGDITLSLPPDQTYLVGNPYPSALDANEFILDNLAGRNAEGKNVFNGALYFWDHFGLSNNHILAEYEGGYATYTLTGGVAGIADSPLTGTGTGSKVPGRFIPVGQGFFVDAALDPTLSGTTSTVDGGYINFKNSQRVFVRETSASSIFMKTAGTKSTKTQETTDTRSKIRLGFDSSVGAHRQLLVGADSNTTLLFDIGYDAPMFDMNDNDMYWELSNSQFVIQAIPDFNVGQIIPLGLTIANEGKATIKIDALENIPEATKIYLYDNITGIYHDIRNSDFTISLAIGEYKNRFSIQFTDKTLDVEENNLNDGLLVLYSNNYKVLIIQNKIPDATVNEVHLFNLLGQAVANWDVKNENQTRIQIPVKNLSSGVYLVKLKTSKGDYGRKIIIK
ncbi:LamG-like jellyroll fold domain-containing protein [Flavobacterium sp. ZB4P13]|uniref:T9SS type A sorting domain-containing protein n=1 Tax=Flavobacterium sp. ZB4P13 TaxID=3401728 RepID=UPI003AB00A05